MDSVFFFANLLRKFLKNNMLFLIVVDKESFGFSMRVDDVGCCIDSLSMRMC